MTTLTPTQNRVVSDLFGAGLKRPQFDPGLADHLRNQMEERLAPLIERISRDKPLNVRKQLLAQVHQCEAFYLTQLDRNFEWSAITARGTVTHKALERLVYVRDVPTPMQLVDDAIESFVESDSPYNPGVWLRDAKENVIADLRGSATDLVTKFLEEFPPLKKEWRPRVESGVNATFCDKRIEVRGKIDLVLGSPKGQTASALVIDFKTGRTTPTHREDLRLYALLETLRCGVPPWRVATYDLDSGTWSAEDINEDVLEAAVRRTCDGIHKIVNLAEKQIATETAGPSCGWCTRRDVCATATAFFDE